MSDVTCEQPPASTVESDFPRTVIYLAGLLDQGVRTELRHRLAAYQLSVPEFMVLSFIDCHPGLSNAELARRALIRPQSMNGVVASLERRGLIERHEDPSHGRILQTGLTVAGGYLLGRVRPLASELQDEIFADASEADREVAVGYLTAAVERLVAMAHR